MIYGFFITGTDTDVGKTWVAAGLLRALRNRGYTTAAMKPVACGSVVTPEGLRNEDALLLVQYASNRFPYEVANPYVYTTPTAPHIAAKIADRRIDIGLIEECFNTLAASVDYVVVEGVGGWQVPLNERETTADLAVALGLPVILVVGLRLGCLNHALLSAESIVRHGLKLAGWVANTVSPDFQYAREYKEALRERIAAPLLGVISYLPEFTVESIADSLDLGLMLDT